MIAFLDVAYGEDDAWAACVLARGWRDEHATRELTLHIDDVAPYESGQFYKRELPALLRILALVTEPLTCVVVDGNVWLDAGRPGLGAHLHEALDRRVPVVGVAKTAFAGNGAAVAVTRGTSKVPLHVTSVGIDVRVAVQHVLEMHGPHRLPTLLKRVDTLCRAQAGGA